VRAELSDPWFHLAMDPIAGPDSVPGAGETTKSAEPTSLVSEPRPSTRERNAGNVTPRLLSRQNVFVLALLGFVGIVVPLAIIFVDVDPHEGPVVAADAASMKPGDCVNMDLALVPCDRWHYGEVFFVGPDRARISEHRVNEASFSEWRVHLCKGLFAVYVGVPLEQTTYLMVTSPSAQQWTAGGRPFLCIAAKPDESLDSSIKGSAK